MIKGGARLVLAASLCALTQAARSGETISYGYDSLGRLVRVDRTGTVNNGVSAQYSYDSADNRTNVTVGTAGSLPPPPTPSSGPAVAGGGFETPDQGSGHLYNATGSPATFTGNSGVAGNGSGWGFAAPEGDQVAFLQGGPGPAVVSLPVTGLTPGASYAASFRISARPNYLGIAVTVSFNGNAVGTFDPATASFAAVTTAAFTAAASTGTLTFTSAAGTVNHASAIDDVTVSVAAAGGGGGSGGTSGTGGGSGSGGSGGSGGGDSGGTGGGTGGGGGAPPQPPANRPPVANPDSGHQAQCTVAVYNVIANDSDPEGGGLSLVSVSNEGGFLKHSSSSVQFRADETGTQQATYVVQDSAGLTAQGTLTVTVSGDPGTMSGSCAG